MAFFDRFTDRAEIPLLRCAPRLLIVADGPESGGLNFRPDAGFGLWRFLEAITLADGVTLKPQLTLAHRGSHVSPVTVGSDSYPVALNFNFATATPAVTIDNYDQIWLFGIDNVTDFGQPISDAERAVIARFMNAGGGVFATGDHATLGMALSGGLPRIRHMREWNQIPMGTEDDIERARLRIDTVVNPGINFGIGAQYQFDDQSDAIPQRIYPNYQVTPMSGSMRWRATVHPLLMLPDAPQYRYGGEVPMITIGGRSVPAIPIEELGPVGAEGFTRDIDVLPDHPHESVCYEVADTTVLTGTYNAGGAGFEEFPVAADGSGARVGAGIVAYGVSGGRSVFMFGVWKPPVRPRMFGLISAYDGREAASYPGEGQRPGRIVCDSTWHHFVNINLDGTGTNPRRTGLGTGLGDAFVPSPELRMIYQYYRNIISWLQPASRQWCLLWWTLAAIRLDPMMMEEMMTAPRPRAWRDFVGLGLEASRRIAAAMGPQAVEQMIIGALRGVAGTGQVGDLLAGAELRQTSIDGGELLAGMLGGMLARMSELLPADNEERAASILEGGPEGSVAELTREALDALAIGLREHAELADRTTAFTARNLEVLRTGKDG